MVTSYAMCPLLTTSLRYFANSGPWSAPPLAPAHLAARALAVAALVATARATVVRAAASAAAHLLTRQAPRVHTSRSSAVALAVVPPPSSLVRLLARVPGSSCALCLLLSPGWVEGASQACAAAARVAGREVPSEFLLASSRCFQCMAGREIVGRSRQHLQQRASVLDMCHMVM